MIRLCLWLTLISIGTKLSGQTPGFSILDIENGLPSNQISVAFQDQLGRLWIGSDEGLARYNGKEVVLIPQQEGFEFQGITSGLITKENTIWLGNESGRIARLVEGQLEPFDLGISFDAIADVIEDNQGKLWFASMSKGLIRIDPESGEVEHFRDDFNALTCYNLIQDRAGRLLVATNDGVFVFRYADGKLEQKGMLPEIPELNATVLLNRRDGNGVWVGTQDFGLFEVIYEAGGSKVENVNVYRLEDGLPSNRIQSLTMGNEGDLWVGTQDQGLARLEFRSGAVYPQTYDQESGIPHPNITTLLADREGSLWIGTAGGGMAQLEQNLFEAFDSRTNGNKVNAVLLDTMGQVWLGTREGLVILEAETGKTLTYGISEGLPSLEITALYRGGDHTVWIGTADQGIVKAVYHNQRLVFSRPSFQPLSRRIKHISSGGSDRLNIATLGAGVNLVDLNDNSVKTLSEKDGLPKNDVYFTFTDSKGRLWMATKGGGLNYYDSKGLRTFYPRSEEEATYFSSMVEDSRGNIWIGTYGEGVYCYDNQRFLHYGMDRGLLSDYIYAIACDEEDKLWVASKKGLSVIGEDRETVYGFPGQEFFASRQVSFNALAFDEDQNLWFGTNNGAMRFLASNHHLNQTPPITRITGFRVGDIDVLEESNPSFSYGQGKITFEFIGVSLREADKVMYQYRLEGYEDEWSPITGLQSVSYPNLPDGEYRFLIRACNNDGIWNPEPASLSFSILPPYWKSPWFYLGIVVLIATVVYVYIRIRVNAYQVKQAELTRLVNDRTAELQQEKETVERQNDMIMEFNKDMTSSITYAKRIQDAVLPRPVMLHRTFPESFVLNRPRDIVSGDFFWQAHQDNKVVLAVADCTGHGVPGAFMSLVGHGALVHAVKRQGLTHPAEILKALNILLRKALKSESGKNLTDGMDISLVTVDLKTRELWFAGAYNPLYVVRKGLEQSELGESGMFHNFEGDLGEIKGNKYPIGRFLEEVKRDFQEHHVSLEAGDTFYLFSDGFADQFGGESGKKFRYSTFKKLLNSFGSMPMQQQQGHLEESLDNWMSGHEQVDDILVVGFRID